MAAASAASKGAAIERAKNLLLYGGQTREEYQELIPDIRRENLKNLKGYAVIVAVVMGIISLACCFTSGGFADGSTIIANLAVYLGAFALSIVFLVVVYALCPARPRLASMLNYVLIAGLFAFALVLTVRHPTLPAVTAVMFMLVLPMLFVDRPIKLVAMSIVLCAAFCVVVNAAKPAVAMDDMWNGGTVTIVAFLFETIVDRVRIQNLFLMRQVGFVSGHDLLTGILNRNSFERDVSELAGRVRTSLAVAYIDLNGLHELNNVHGHEAGDAVLKQVATAMRAQFGPSTYRLGGDEFLSFVFDCDREGFLCDVRRLERELTDRGCSVSAGCAWAEAPVDDVEGLVRHAEAQMRAVKRGHYDRLGVGGLESNRHRA